MPHRVTEMARSTLPAAAFMAALLAALEAAVSFGMANKSFVPMPSSVFARAFDIVSSGQVVAPLAHTLAILSVGYGIGCLAAVVLGTLMGFYRPIYNLFEPLIELIRPIPKAALLPVLILFLGLGAAMKITIVALAAFPPVLINTVQGVRAVEPVLTDMARTFGHSSSTVLWRILLPASGPYIVSGMRISLGICLIVEITAEMLSASGGLGDVILQGQRMFRVVDSYAWLVIVAIFGFALNTLFHWIERRATFWVVPAQE